MKIAWFKTEISPRIGDYLAGYSDFDVSSGKLDDLYVHGLCLNDGSKKILLISLDLLGLDRKYIEKFRKNCAEILGVPESAVMLSCTHTHSGPETRTMSSLPERLNTRYLAELEEKLNISVKGLTSFHECETYFYSAQCDENRNRRYTAGDNHATFSPCRREFLNERSGIADKELGGMMFFDRESKLPLYVIGNYAAHPLAGHSIGLGGRRISADFPGAFRDYVTANTGAECMFVSGAAGDLVPREDELGVEAMRSMGIRLAKEAIGSCIEAERNPMRYQLKDPKVAHCSRTVRVRVRKAAEEKLNEFEKSRVKDGMLPMEIQCISVGDVCFVGVPGELCNELGLEIKWHSPFRRTFIAYNSTAYSSYLCPANFLVSGGYEGMAQAFTARCGLQLVNTAVDAMFELRESVCPSEDEPYPDACKTELVNILPNW